MIFTIHDPAGFIYPLWIPEGITAFAIANQFPFFCQILQHPLDLAAAVVHMEGGFADIGDGVVGTAPAQIGNQGILCCGHV